MVSAHKTPSTDEPVSCAKRHQLYPNVSVTIRERYNVALIAISHDIFEIG